MSSAQASDPAAYRRTIDVTGPNPYQVTIGFGLDEQLVSAVGATDSSKVVIIHQPPLRDMAARLSAALQRQGLESIAVAVPDAEESKTRDVLGKCWDLLGSHNVGRRDLIIGLGGGAVTDLAGFVAASWLRGVRVIHMPTSLLGMVDAAVGGKTGINTPAGKNLVGAFHEPSAVFLDLAALHTLPQHELVAGSAEIVKAGFIADEAIVDLYEASAAAALDLDGSLPELVARAVQVKATVVSQDFKESGLREILNYGHTFAHAIELREHYQWRHGNAVAVGMMFAAHLAHDAGLIDEALVTRHRDVLESVGLPTTYEPGHFAQLLEGMSRDKKNRAGNLRFVVIDGQIGEMTRLVAPTEDALRAAYSAIAPGDSGAPTPRSE